MTRPVPERVVRAYLAPEIRAATIVAALRGLKFEHYADSLSATMRMTGPPAQHGQPEEDYLVWVQFDGYRAIPPAWRFVDPRNGKHAGLAGYPKGSGNTVLHSDGLICAHWSRLAYKQEGGIHEDWGAPSNWRNVRTGQTIALTLPDMIDRLIRDVCKSAGRLAPLPQEA
jgi:hypothetical protein